MHAAIRLVYIERNKKKVGSEKFTSLRVTRMCVRAGARVYVCVCVTKSVLRRNGNSILFVVEKNHRAKNLPRVKSAARRIPASQPAPATLPLPLPSLPFHHAGSRLCHRRPFACIFMKSLFRTTIHRDEQRTMTASAAEMEARRWRQREGRKKKRAKNDRGGGGRAASIHPRGRWCEGKSAYANTRHIQPLVPAVRSFVRFFVMTVDETMTYFSGFSLPGCPAALPFMPSSCLPVSIILRRRPSPPPVAIIRNTRAASGAFWIFFHRVPKSRAFSFFMSPVILRESLSLNSFSRAQGWFICKTGKHSLTITK